MTVAPGAKRPKAALAAAPEAFAGSVGYLVGAISNILSAGGSRLYRRAFGIGLSEWRTMWVLAIEPRITARRAAQIMGVDKGAVSRALAGLSHRGLVRIAPDPSDNRQRIVELSESGVALHARIMIVARERERRLHAAFTRDELRTLAGLLRRLHGHAAEVSAFDPQALLRQSASPPGAAAHSSARTFT